MQLESSSEQLFALYGFCLALSKQLQVAVKGLLSSWFMSDGPALVLDTCIWGLASPHSNL
jgi:hypothetical protein